jgi:hypothetical protein
MKNFDFKPLIEMLSDEIYPEALAKVIDGLIFDYIFALLEEPNREIEKPKVQLQIVQLQNFRDRLLECKEFELP